LRADSASFADVAVVADGADRAGVAYKPARATSTDSAWCTNVARDALMTRLSGGAPGTEETSRADCTARAWDTSGANGTRSAGRAGESSRP